MITIPGLAELVVWIPALLIPSILIYFDARKKGKNPYFWSAVIFVGLMLNYWVGLLLTAAYVYTGLLTPTQLKLLVRIF